MHSSRSSNDTGHHTNVGAIVGPIVAILAVILITIAFVVLRRRRQRHRMGARHWFNSNKPNAVDPYLDSGHSPLSKTGSPILPSYASHEKHRDNGMTNDAMAYAGAQAGHNSTSAQGYPSTMSEKSRLHSDPGQGLNTLEYDVEQEQAQTQPVPTAGEHRSTNSMSTTVAPPSADVQNSSDMRPSRPLPASEGHWFPNSDSSSNPLLPGGAGNDHGSTEATLSSTTVQFEGELVERIIERVAARIAPPPGSALPLDDSADAAHLPPYSETS